MNGLLLVDKPAGITSHDVVARARRTLGERRIGHAGTLDPPATGLLVLGIGRATRLLRFLEVHEKAYDATIAFGVTTSTLDAAGEALGRRDASTLDRPTVEAILPRFRGPIEQVPPMVSAVKVAGVRLHELARRGQDVERAPRTVTIHRLELLAFSEGDLARADVHVVCSKGTYIRSLAADIGEALGVGGHVERLRRTRVGPYDVDDACPIDDIGASRIRPMADAAAGYPRHAVDEAGVRALIQGKPLPAAGIAGPYAIFGPEGLVAMAEDREEEARSLCVVAQT